jgi:CRISPR-associated protein Cmr6
LQGQLQRIQALVHSLADAGFLIATIDNLETQWRLAAGLGSKGALEIGLTLHPTCGFPYIPSSSLKGLSRAVAFVSNPKFNINLRFLDTYVEQNDARSLLEKNESNKLKRLLSYKKKDADGREHQVEPSDSDVEGIRAAKDDLELIRKLFGSQSQAGKVIFFDAFPTEFPKLEVDVVNVHYQDYYSKGEPPGDWMSPVPSFFLAVAPNTRFNFYLASRDNGLLAQAKEWLYNGLTQLGIGGKTNAGYGYFRPVGDGAATTRVSTNQARQTVTPAIPPGSTLAIVTTVGDKWVEVKIEGVTGSVRCSGINPAGLHLKPGSIVYVELKREKKTGLVVSATYRGKPPVQISQ